MGGKRTVTVLFTDLVGSTALSARLDPAADDRLRESHFGLLRDEVTDAGGVVVKNLGDGVMVAFDSARAALTCAVRMQQAVDRHNRTAEESLAVRIGIATGEATEQEDDFFGEPVVIAARLCALANGGQILATDVVRAVAGRHLGVDFVELGAMELKGLPELVPSLEVRWEATDDAAVVVSLSARLETAGSEPFVGRAEELAMLVDELKAVGSERRCRVVLVGGEAGIGKTSLAGAFARSARADGSAVVYGRCEEELGIAYQPWAEALSHLIEHSPPRLLDAVLATHGADLSRLSPNMAGLAPAGGGSSDPETLRYLLFGAVLKVLQAAGRDRPVVVVLDDLHWADVPTLQLLRHVISSDLILPLLVIGMFRESDVTAGRALTDVLARLHLEPGVTRLHLDGLGEAELLTLLGVNTGPVVDEAALALCDALGRETDGNPFFVGELLRHLTETGVIDRDADGSWSTRGDLAKRGLPMSVRDVIGHRAARLGAEALRILSFAAVMGRDFDLAVVSAASDRGEEDVLDVLDAAIAATLVTNVAGEKFSFAHALVGHALYDALTPARRVRAHRRIAEAIEAICGADTESRIMELAYHYNEACGPDHGAQYVDKAVTYARAAGDRALANLAPSEALRWYERALALLDEASEDDQHLRCALNVGIGDAQRQSGDPRYRDTLLAAGREAVLLSDTDSLVAAALANTRGTHSNTGWVDYDRLALVEAAVDAVGTADTRVRARLLSVLALHRIIHDDYPALQAVADEAVAIARRIGDPFTLLDVLTRCDQSIRVPDSLEYRLASTAEADRLARQLGDPVGRFWSNHQRTYAAIESADWAEATRCQNEASELAARIGQPTLRWLDARNKSLFTLMAGDASTAETLVEEAFAFGRATGQPDAAVMYAIHLQWVRWHQGRGNEVVDLYEARAGDNPHPFLRAILARLYLDIGRYDDARELLSVATAAGFRCPRDNTVLGMLANYAEVAVGFGDHFAVDLLVDQLAPWATQVICTMTYVGGAVAHYLGLLEQARADYEAAHAHFTNALAINERLQAPFHLARTHLQMGAMALERGLPKDVSEARLHLEAARDLALRYGCTLVGQHATDLLDNV